MEKIRVIHQDAKALTGDQLLALTRIHWGAGSDAKQDGFYWVLSQNGIELARVPYSRGRLFYRIVTRQAALPKDPDAAVLCKHCQTPKRDHWRFGQRCPRPLIAWRRWTCFEAIGPGPLDDSGAIGPDIGAMTEDPMPLDVEEWRRLEDGRQRILRRRSEADTEGGGV